MKYLFLFDFCLAFMVYSIYADFHQEKAQVLYANPKYVKDCSASTGRQGLNHPDYTNLTVTTLMPYGNNVSAAVTFQLASGGEFRVSNKLCDVMKDIWITNFLNTHSDLDSRCPVPPGTYNIFDIELPQKNMPIPMIASDYIITLEMYLTRTKEQILKVLMSLSYEESKWKNE